ncbi:MAG: GFA family protein [Hyphomonadaceae bacterium]
MPAKPPPLKPKPETKARAGPTRAEGQCACGAVAFEIAIPAQWAWHDHSRATRRAHGAAYATYVGSWKSRFRFVRGEDRLTRYEDKANKATRSFCSICGTPVTYVRSPQNVNIPRALFSSGVGREPRYHIGIDDMQDWTYLGERLGPLKGFPGVVWTGGRRKPR